MSERKIVWVCGGCKGIGAAIARLHSARDDRVWVSHRGSPDCFSADWPRLKNVEYMSGELVEPDTVTLQVNEILDKHGGLDAIYMCHHRPLTELSELLSLEWSDLELQFQSIMRPAYNIIRSILNSRDREEPLSIVCMSTYTVMEGTEGVVARSVAKGALEAFVRSAAAPLGGRNIRINGLSIGWTSTPQLDEFISWGGVVDLSSIPLGRVANPEEIARTAFFLGSNESSYITGSIFPVAGGLTPEPR